MWYLFLPRVLGCPLLGPYDTYVCASMYPRFVKNIREELFRFRESTGVSLKESARLSRGYPSGVIFEIRSGNVSCVYECHDNQVSHWIQLLSLMSPHLPDMDIPINLYDEPRVKHISQTNCTNLDHGFWILPDTETYIEQSKAVFFSSSRTPCDQDILIPSMHHYTNGQPNLWEHHKWSSKSDVIYWRGASTGMKNLKTNWRHNHRIKLASTLVNNSKTDVGIYLVGQCNDACVDMYTSGVEEGWLRSPSDMKTWSQYKYLLDIDGNTYSMRFTAFALWSRSLILRAGVFKNWFD